MSRYRIEYLTETTDEDSVCCIVAATAATLEGAGDTAFGEFERARSSFGAGGFQIRDMSIEHAPIVALETLDSQLA